jgi:hypothetical protein
MGWIEPVDRRSGASRQLSGKLARDGPAGFSLAGGIQEGGIPVVTTLARVAGAPYRRKQGARGEALVRERKVVGRSGQDRTGEAIT